MEEVEPEDESPDNGEPASPKVSTELQAALAVCLADATRRMVRRVATHAERAAKEPARFMDWIGSFGVEHVNVADEALKPAVHACRVATGDRSALGRSAFPGNWLLGRLREEYLALADRTQPKHLAQATAALTSSLEVRIPAEACSLFLPEAPCATN
jgi:hypothetical protein